MNEQNEKNEKNEQEEYAPSERQNPMEDTLADSNEQEQRKVGFSCSASSERETQANCAPKQEKGGLPIRQKRAGAVRHAEGGAAFLPLRSEPPKDPPKENKSGAAFSEQTKRGMWWRMVMAGSLVFAVGVMIFALMTAANIASGVTSDAPSEEEPTADAAEKIVFVRQYDDHSGVMTAAELYAEKAKTVVSVVARGENTVSIGSGFLITSDGYIGTVNHVAADGAALTVLLSDGTEYPATKVAGNALTDLALLKIDGTNLPVVTFGSSADLLTGETVYAIGTPASADYAGSLCRGLVSCAKRTVRVTDAATGTLEKKMTLIQTDAPVNPGNSGCPLFDEQGNVIGMMTMRLGNEFDGIGFAIPSDGAVGILYTMMRGETLSDSLLAAVGVPAPKLGIAGEVTSREGFRGVEIVRFSAKDSSASATLKVGDLITAIDETPISSLSDIAKAIEQKDPGDAVMVTVLRAGQLLSFSVVLEKS